jgi:hypothetical protein
MVVIERKGVSHAYTLERIVLLVLTSLLVLAAYGAWEVRWDPNGR